jgi:hypothetical protein
MTPDFITFFLAYLAASAVTLAVLELIPGR